MYPAAKGRAGSSRSRLPVLLACSCALLVLLYAPRRRRTPVLGQSGLGHGAADSSGAGHGSSSGGGGAGGTSGDSGVDCKLDRLIGEGPFAQSCHLIKDVCVDQVRAPQAACLLATAPAGYSARLPSPGHSRSRPPRPACCLLSVCSAPPSCTAASTTQHRGVPWSPCLCWSPPSATATTSLFTRRR